MSVFYVCVFYWTTLYFMSVYPVFYSGFFLDHPVFYVCVLVSVLYVY